MKPLKHKVAVVAGATRGAGRGIARMLGEAGATVYCTGRGSRDRPSSDGPFAGRPETIDETATMVDAAGGIGIPVRVDHRVEAEVVALFARVRREQKRLDVLVNVFWGGPAVKSWGSFWTYPLDEGRALADAAWPHVITCRHAAPLMIKRKAGLIVQITEGDALYYRQNLFYDLARITEIRLAYAMAEELAKHGVTALALTPGYMRTEAVLEANGVTEQNWRDGAKKDGHFIASETPCFVGRTIVALALDPNVKRKAGGLYSSWALAEEYQVNDIDGNRPNIWARLGDSPGGAPRTGVRWRIER